MTTDAMSPAEVRTAFGCLHSWRVEVAGGIGYTMDSTPLSLRA
jgi:hypothetical protein